jgi:DnaJ-class molecular chaperone
VTLPTQAKPDYYEVLGVSHAATEQEIRNAFEELTTEFHAAGKPTNIDDVEWLRTVARAYRVLTDNELRKHYDRTGDDTNIAPARPAGYDQELLEKWSRQVDFQTKLQRNLWLAHFAADFFFG